MIPKTVTIIVLNIIVMTFAVYGLYHGLAKARESSRRAEHGAIFPRAEHHRTVGDMRVGESGWVLTIYFGGDLESFLDKNQNVYDKGEFLNAYEIRKDSDGFYVLSSHPETIPTFSSFRGMGLIPIKGFLRASGGR